MQRMQDKEFDQLFKDRFEEAEIQAPAGLWDSIAEELEPKKKKVSLPLYWMSAAAIAGLALSVGLLSPKTETVKLQSPVAVQAEQPVKSPEANAQQAVHTTLTGAETVNNSTPLVIAPRLTEAEMKNSLAAVQPQEPADHPVHKAPDTFAAAAEKNEPLKQAEPGNEAVIAKVDLPVENAVNSITEAPQAEHRGIRNVGDLVNFVVGKVDKRENKIVQFDTDEDDNSSLVSLNLGIIKIGKKSSK